jgi:hypothetical protein
MTGNIMHPMRPRQPFRAAPAAAALAVLLLASCSGPARVEVDPPSVRFHARDQTASVRARVLGSDGKLLPREACSWTSGDPRVVTVDGRPAGALLLSVGPGATTVSCQVGAARADVAVSVRLAARVEVSPPVLEIAVRDEPAPAQLRIAAVDSEGKPLLDRPASSRCADERVCRGDDRGQIWPVGPGASEATVVVDGAAGTLTVKVRDERTTEGRPRAVKGNPMLDVEKAFAPPPPGKARP